MIFSFLSILHVLECISNFLRFWVFFGIVLVKQCLWLLFHFLKFPCHNPGPRVCISHFSHLLYFSTCSRSYSVWVSFSTYFNFFFFFFFLPHSRSYIVHFSFFTFFNVSHDIPCLRVFLCHFSHFSDFLPYSRSYCVHFSFFSFFTAFLAIFHFLQCVFRISMIFSFFSIIHSHSVFLIFYVFECFSG